MLKDIVTKIGEVYSIPNLLNAVLCFAEILDVLYFQVVSEFSFGRFINILVWLAFFVLKLVLILGSSAFVTLKVSHDLNFSLSA